MSREELDVQDLDQLIHHQVSVFSSESRTDASSDEGYNEYQSLRLVKVDMLPIQL